MSIDPAHSVASLVLERPSRARALERLGLDYCCGGKRSLAEACAERGLDLTLVVETLEAMPEGESTEDTDWSRAPLGELCDHIVTAHHERLRRELPRLATLLDKVVGAHAAERPELEELRSAFTARALAPA